MASVSELVNSTINFTDDNEHLYVDDMTTDELGIALKTLVKDKEKAIENVQV